MKQGSLILFVLSLQLSSCYYDVQEELHPGASLQICDTSNSTYSSKVRSILVSNCVSCHNQNQASANINLDNYTGVKAVADNGKLEGSIEHLAGYLKMPQNLQQLSECDRLVIKNWIKNGSTNN